MEKPSVREMIRRASRPGGLGVSQAARPDASPVKGTCPKKEKPRRDHYRRRSTTAPAWSGSFPSLKG